MQRKLAGGLRSCAKKADELRSEGKFVGSFNWDSRNGDCYCLGDKGVGRDTGVPFPCRSGGCRKMVFCADAQALDLSKWKSQFDPSDRASYFKLGSAWNKYADRFAQ